MASFRERTYVSWRLVSVFWWTWRPETRLVTRQNGELLRHFHALIRSRFSELAPATTQLPPMPTSQDLMKTLVDEQGWLPVSGMYGGFVCKLISNDASPIRLHLSSWSRVIAGSEQTHEITATDGARLVDEEDGLELVLAE